MRNNPNKQKNLIEKYLAGECNPDELAQVEEWYNHLAFQKETINSAENLKEIKGRIWRKINPRAKWPYLKWSAVACLLTVAGSFLLINKTSQNKVKPLMARTSIGANPNFVCLTMPNGQQVNLDKLNDGEHRYTSLNFIKQSQKISVKNTLSHTGQEQLTLSVPSGKTYAIQLADGTNVTLDAQSSLSFPRYFTTTTRNVALKGQAFFDVAHLSNSKFTVSANQQMITVLGTHFNVKSTTAGNVKTTLLQGKVLVKGKKNQMVLAPGQSVKDNNGLLVKNETENLESVMSWKAGYFWFEEANIQKVMNDLAAWYGFQVDYRNNAYKQNFSGKISRSLSLEEVLKIIEFSKIKILRKNNMITIY